MAAAKCSDTHDFAVPGTPYSRSARSVASVATAVSMMRRFPIYLADTVKPLSSSPPSR